MTTIEETRNHFEERVFADYFIRSITRNSNTPAPKMSGALDFVSTCKLDKSQLCERDAEGNYTREDVSAMWHGWQLALKWSDLYGDD